MRFDKFSSIENSYRQKVIDMIVLNGFSQPEITWVALEKIHGANFSLWYDGTHMKSAKRSGWITEDENFYGSKAVAEKYFGALDRLYGLLSLIPGEETLTVYGELCGGSGEGFKQVQKEVYYFDHVEFLAFEVRVNGTPIPIQESFSLLSKAGFQLVPYIARGTFDKMIHLDENFDSMVSFREGNKAEGLVIRPDKPLWFGNGSAVVLKKKAEAFSEKKGKQKTLKAPVELSEQQTEVYEYVGSYLTENRLKNVLSKIGEVTQKDFGKIMGLLVQDALEDAQGDSGVNYKEQLGDEWKRVIKLINNDASVLIRSNFLNILDGNF